MTENPIPPEYGKNDDEEINNAYDKLVSDDKCQSSPDDFYAVRYYTSRNRWYNVDGRYRSESDAYRRKREIEANCDYPVKVDRLTCSSDVNTYLSNC